MMGWAVSPGIVMQSQELFNFSESLFQSRSQLGDMFHHLAVTTALDQFTYIRNFSFSTSNIHFYTFT
jgi:hypothetical protein